MEQVHALQVVGWEGLWGLGFLSLGLAVAYRVPLGQDVCAGAPCLENAPAAAAEVAGSGPLAAAVGANLLSVALFNFCGVRVTQSLSATHRMVACPIHPPTHPPNPPRPTPAVLTSTSVLIPCLKPPPA